MLEYLILCSHSVADQEKISTEHIIVDNNSSDGTGEWLRSNTSIIKVIEQDSGMYDAINKGIRIAKGNIISYLNCDEQYLPNALNNVKEYFLAHPDVDIVYGNVLITDPSGKLLAYRKTLNPRYPYIILGNLSIFTCATFFRRKIFDEGFNFNHQLKSVGDAEFILSLRKAGFKFGHLNEYLSVFLKRDDNLGTSQISKREQTIFRNRTSARIKHISFLVNILKWFEKGLRGAYFQRFPIEYSIYTGSDSSKRTKYLAEESSFKWPK
jgi:glycosyltransferase involved in cell wall biosynthesis